MLLHKSEPFSDPSYCFEGKMDGIRIILSKINGRTKIHTRHNTDVTDRYPELLTIPVQEDVILDGEIICYTPGSRTEKPRVDFELCMERFMTKSAQKRSQIPVHYVVWDIIHFNGNDLKNLSLLERKKILDSVIPDTETISKIRYIKEHGEKLFEAIKEMDLEGMVAKRLDSKYFLNHRSKDWLKVINWKYENVYISGYRKDKFGWLCSVKDKGKFRYVGVLELGTKPSERKAFYGVAKSLIKYENSSVVYIDPKIQVRVKIRNWTRNNMLRSPVFDQFVL